MQNYFFYEGGDCFSMWNKGKRLMAFFSVYTAWKIKSESQILLLHTWICCAVLAVSVTGLVMDRLYIVRM